jgi:hypothetical protein
MVCGRCILAKGSGDCVISVATKEKANMPPEEAVRAVVTPVAKLNVVNRHRPPCRRGRSRNRG